MPDTLILVGIGDALGVPRVYCDCDVCQEARTTGANRRRRCSAVLQSMEGECLWLDCGPDWRAQMEEVGQRVAQTVCITHAHHDHIGGLPDLADALRWTRTTGQVLVPPSVCASIMRQYPWLVNTLQFSEITAPLVRMGYQIMVWEVSHGHNGRSFAYRFTRPGYAWAYCPDSIYLSPAEREPLLGLDLLILGTAYYHEEQVSANRSIYDMREAIELLAEIQPHQTIFTHLSHGIDCRRAYPLPDNVILAREGMRIPLDS